MQKPSRTKAGPTKRHQQREGGDKAEEKVWKARRKTQGGLGGREAYEKSAKGDCPKRAKEKKAPQAEAAKGE